MKKVKRFFLNIGKHIWVYIIFCVVLIIKTVEMWITFSQTQHIVFF